MIADNGRQFQVQKGGSIFRSISFLVKTYFLALGAAWATTKYVWKLRNDAFKYEKEYDKLDKNVDRIFSDAAKSSQKKSIMPFQKGGDQESAVRDLVKKAAFVGVETIKSAFVTALITIGKINDMDLTDVNKTQKVLDKIVVTLTNPAVMKKAVDAASAYAKIKVAEVNASRPAIKEFANIAGQVIYELVKDLSKHSPEIVGNFLKSVPGVGNVISVMDASTALFTTGVDTATSAKKIAAAASNIGNNTTNTNTNNTNTNTLANQRGGSVNRKTKEKILKKIGGSIEEFHNSTLHPKKIFSKSRKNKNRWSPPKKSKTMRLVTY